MLWLWSGAVSNKRGITGTEEAVRPTSITGSFVMGWAIRQFTVHPNFSTVNRQAFISVPSAWSGAYLSSKHNLNVGGCRAEREKLEILQCIFKMPHLPLQNDLGSAMNNPPEQYTCFQIKVFWLFSCIIYIYIYI